MDEKKRYSYAGPVMLYGKIIDHSFKGDTMAFTPAKALSNLSWRFKKKHGYSDLSTITLDKRYLTILY